MSDRREYILLAAFEKHKQSNPNENWASWEVVKSDGTVDICFDAMDEYMKEMCLELLGYLAKEGVECYIGKNGEQVFYSSNGPLVSYSTKEQLFENFL